MAGSLGDLVIPRSPGIPAPLVIPANELIERFSRSSGPGGQGVNTTDSRVELLWDPESSVIEALQHLSTTRIVVTTHRSQHRNRLAARARLVELIQRALAPPPPPRVPTKPSKSAQRRRLDAKQRRSMTKSLRGRVRDH
jgi:ribosome-associated protein